MVEKVLSTISTTAFGVQDNKAYGYCHLNPPKVLGTFGRTMSQYLVVTENDWCGQFKQRAENLEQALNDVADEQISDQDDQPTE